jgi:hypothetical protein
MRKVIHPKKYDRKRTDLSKRKCLRCGKVFTSMHIAHRICNDCKDINILVSDPWDGWNR